MLAIPGKYVDKNGGEYNLILTAIDEESREKTVIYTDKSKKGYYSIPLKKWESNFLSAEKDSYDEYCETGDFSDVEQKFSELFCGRDNVYSVHWRSTFGTEGYNYACSAEKFVNGCMKGTDSCKNCKSGRLQGYTIEAVKKHLGGEINAGIYPVTDDGKCKFALICLNTKEQGKAVLEICKEFEIPSYAEIFKDKVRIWFFFATFVSAKYANMFANTVISAAMEKYSCIGQDLYKYVVPSFAPVEAGSFGKPVMLPISDNRCAKSFFTDENLTPLADKGEIIKFRTITKNYLADRMSALGAQNYGCLYSGVRERNQPLEFTEKIEAELCEGVKIRKRNLSPKALAVFKRMSSFKNADGFQKEFEPLSDPIEMCYDETEKEICVPRGVWQDLEEILKMSHADYSVAKNRVKGKSIQLNLKASVNEEAAMASKALLSQSEGIILGNIGSGKTFAVLKTIYDLSVSTLILTPDEYTRKRWTETIYKYFSMDENSGRIDVKTVEEDKIRNRYGLVIVADCNRMPMSREIFCKIKALTPERIYAIATDDRRRDGLWGYVHMLCGDVVFKMSGK